MAAWVDWKPVKLGLPEKSGPPRQDESLCMELSLLQREGEALETSMGQIQTSCERSWITRSLLVSLES